MDKVGRHIRLAQARFDARSVNEHCQKILSRIFLYNGWFFSPANVPYDDKKLMTIDCKSNSNAIVTRALNSRQNNVSLLVKRNLTLFL